MPYLLTVERNVLLLDTYEMVLVSPTSQVPWDLEVKHEIKSSRIVSVFRPNVYIINGLAWTSLLNKTKVANENLKMYVFSFLIKP
jgi:hypothetical protein